MKYKSPPKKNPLVQIIQIGIEIWIRSKCKYIHKINIQLNGSPIGILSGKLSGINLNASDVNFKNLPLHSVELSSGPLRISINPSKKKQRINLEKAFKVQGNISMTNQDLNKLILSKKWEWIGRLLSKNLLQADNLESIEICNDMIKLNGYSKNSQKQFTGEFKVEAESGTLVFLNQHTSQVCKLPMDPSIDIKHVTLKDGKLFINGQSEVNP